MARPGAHRKFYDFVNSEVQDKVRDDIASTPDLVKYVAENIIGSATAFSTPFGTRKVVYCDYIASGRSVKFIEDYISSEVLPQYGSTHTTSSVTALQTSLFRHEARDIIRNATKASEHDRVLFVGSGATGALQKLIHGLKLSEAPVVFVDPYTHHSSLLPWREIGATVIRIRETRVGGIDHVHLEDMLKLHQGKSCRLIGCFTAASNVTGIMADDVELTILLHKYGALAFWDYATAAPYVDLKMNPLVSGDCGGLAHKDAVYFSMHKFLGGVQTPGILIAKKSLFENSVPEVCGGGTVFYVSRDSHRYLQDLETREEGGTPAIVESIRAGLVMQLKNSVTPEFITTRNTHLLRKLSELSDNVEELEVLGNVDFPNRLPILSFVVRHLQSGLLLHHNFICAVLNDVYGIQARGGCACAGPYAQDLLGIDEDLAQRYEKLLVEDCRLDRSHLRRQHEHSDVEVLRPGFVRLNIPYTASDEQVDFILSAVREVCINGWRLLPKYNFNPQTGEWKHHTNLVFRERLWLQNISYAKGFFSYQRKNMSGEAPNYEDCLIEARQIFNHSNKVSLRRQVPEDIILFREEAARLRWFLLPSEAKEFLAQPTTSVLPGDNCGPLPFTPLVYPLKESDLCTRPDFVWQPTGPYILNTKTTNVSMKFNPNIQNRANETVRENMCTLPEITKEKMEISEDKGRDQNGQNGENINISSCNKQQHHISSVSRAARDDHKHFPTQNYSDASSSEEDENTAVSCDHSGANVGTQEQRIDHDKLIEKERAPDEKVSILENEKTFILENEKTSILENEKTSILENEKTSKLGDEKASTLNNKKASLLDNLKSSSLDDGKKFIFDKDNIHKKNDSVVSSNKRSKVVCEDLSCFMQRKDTSPCTVTSVQNKWHSPPKNIFNPAVEALQEFDMIKDGDRVLVCLSGGKDSLSLLHTLRQYQFYAGARGIHFSVGAVTVDPMSASYDPRPLVPYLASLGVPYFFEQQDILKQAADLENLNSICSFCSRMKRGRIYATARRERYNVLAFGQHLDDLAESFMMSVFHNGRLRTMKAHYNVKEGDLRVIRPFVYVREKDLRRFAESKKLPVIPENCPACFESPKERHRVKQMLAQQEVLFPGLYWSLRTALHPVMAINATGMENAIFGKKGTLGILSKLNGSTEDDEA
nr:uncharacterized protein LOC123770444 [Procambarus clarkii]